MAKNLQISNYLARRLADEFNADFSPSTSADVELYDGTQPEFPDEAVTTQNLLVTINLDNTVDGNTIFSPADQAYPGGRITLNEDTVITPGAVAIAGTATWFRMYEGGSTGHVDGSVGTSGADMNLSDIVFTTDETATITDFVITVPNS
jgi:hypothetical protein